MTTPTRSVSDVLYGRLRAIGWTPPGASPVTRFADPPPNRSPVPPTAPGLRLARLPGVRIFATNSLAGRDRPWNIRDLSAVARNFERLSRAGLFSVPLTISHSEDPFDDGATGKPALGWVERVRVKPYKDATTGRWEAYLEADLAGIPSGVRRLISQGSYPFVSSELYSDWTDDFGRSVGPALRRVALLGFSPPACKRLGPIDPSKLTFSEPRTPGRSFRLVGHRRGSAGASYFTFFTEQQQMDPQSLIEAIKAACPTLSDSWFDGIGPDKLKELLAALPDGSDDADATGQQYADDPTQQAGAGMVPAADPTDPQVQRADLADTKKYAEKNAKLLAKSGYREPWKYVQMFSEAQKKNPGIAHEMANIHRQAMAGKAAR